MTNSWRFCVCVYKNVSFTFIPKDILTKENSCCFLSELYSPVYFLCISWFRLRNLFQQLDHDASENGYLWIILLGVHLGMQAWEGLGAGVNRELSDLNVEINLLKRRKRNMCWSEKSLTCLNSKNGSTWLVPSLNHSQSLSDSLYCKKELCLTVLWPGQPPTTFLCSITLKWTEIDLEFEPLASSLNCTPWTTRIITQLLVPLASILSYTPWTTSIITQLYSLDP